MKPFHMRRIWNNWDFSQRTEFHSRLVLTAGESSRSHLFRPRMPTVSTPPRRSQISREEVVQAGSMADGEVADTEIGYCNYAGFLSIIQDDGVCLSPWMLKRNAEAKKSLSIAYVEYNPCGRKNVIRCNPVLYGTKTEHGANPRCLVLRRSGQGCCVQVVDENNGQSSTDSCNEAIFGGESDRIQSFVSSLSNNPQKLAKYLLSSLQIIKSCPETSVECQNLQELVSISLDTLEDKESLQCSLAMGLVSLGVDTSFLDDVSDRLSLSEGISDAWNWAQERKRNLDNMITDYQRDPRTRSSVSLLLENLDRKQDTMVERGQQDRSDRSIQDCYKFVKRALGGASLVDIESRGRRHDGVFADGIQRRRNPPLADNRFFDGTYSDSYARNGEEALNSYGFIDITEFGQPLDRDLAPADAILVYKKRGDPHAPGHIEMVVDRGNGNRQYCSDFCHEGQAIGDDRYELTGILIHRDQ